jgi:hypothetical protein
MLAIGKGECPKCDELMDALQNKDDKSGMEPLASLLEHRQKEHADQPKGTCEECNQLNETGPIAYYRIGTQELGYGNIGIMGCNKHVRLALDRLNDWTNAEMLTKKD